MSAWHAVAVPSVSKEVLRDALAQHGVDWDSANHVTATTSLAAALRTGGRRGAVTAEEADSGGFETHTMPIATLIDLLVLPGWPDEWQLPLDAFPAPRIAVDSGIRVYDTAVRHWQKQASGRRMRMGVTFDDCLRRVARSGDFSPHVARAVVSARREVSRTVHALIAAGVAPSHLDATDDVTRLTLAAWEETERELPALAGHRRDLWIDPEDVEQRSEHAQSVMRRLHAALEACFGSCDGVRRIVHHGFYFYTPPQWALFQLLRQVQDVEQYFVVHDDGDNPCFESWRRFFTPALDMPEPVQASSATRAPTEMALALRRSLAGEAVEYDVLHGALQIIECRSPAEFVRELETERRMVDGLRAAGEPRLRAFAADKDSVERFVKRLGRTGADSKVDLAHLPVGQFLLALHDCVRPGSDGRAVINLTPDALLDIATSGYLIPEAAKAGQPSAVPALRRALPYFQDCRTADDWTARAEQLLLLVEAEVVPLGERRDADSDLDRIASAAANPLRVLPWADLSCREAQFVRDVVVAAVEAVKSISARERVRLGDHADYIREQLHRGMRDLPEELRDQIAAQLDGFSIGLDLEVEADALIDVVAMLLGREVSPEIGHEPDPDGADLDHLRGLDALGYMRAAQSIHVANLADTAFPGRVTAVGWPFTLDHLRSARVGRATVEILGLRAETAALSDMYLFWLALDGVEPGKRAVLSWISDVAGDPRNPSALLTLLTDPSKLHDNVRRRTGGVPIEHVASQAEREAKYAVPLPSPPTAADDALPAAVGELPPAAAASAVICARRFAIQWAMGPSAAFQADHHHTMLYGNVYGSLVRSGVLAEGLARELCDDLWAYLTSGQRESSRSKSVIQPAGRSAHPLWRLTLKGSQTGSNEFDRAYQLGIEDGPVPVAAVADVPEGLLPVGTENAEACRNCPVRPRCKDSDDGSDRL